MDVERVAFEDLFPDWQPMETAPKDGTQILVCRNNGCGWEYDVVWWSAQFPKYPWAAEGTHYPEGRLDYWRLPFAPPYPIEN